MEIPVFVREILAKLESAGYEAWCVGGCVRDLLLGTSPSDWDVTTSALPEEVLSLFVGCSLPTGLQHGTITVCTEEGNVEVTTFRKDGAYLDHRRPESVEFTATLEEDLLRRDFTVNAMAMDLRGELRDPYGGRADLEKRVLRCVGDPDARFEEDALRIMRALRFSAVIPMEIEPATAERIHAKRELLRDIAAERIQTELCKLLCGQCAADVLRLYPDVIGVFWPELLETVGFDQKNYHHCYDVWEHTLHAVEATPSDLILRLTVLLHDIGKPRCFLLDEQGVGHFRGHGAVSRDLSDAMLRRLKFSNAVRETVVRLVEWHDRKIVGTERAIRRALFHLGEADLRRLIMVKRADNLAQAPEFLGRQQELTALEELLEEVLRADACFSLKQLAVDGSDLQEMGFVGAAIGTMLRKLLSCVIEEELPNEREALLGFAGNWINGEDPGDP